ncbi:Gfo/Idh/MocA family protein [Virgisporangium ochraceum]|uniref:Gfo/Idh/MocA family protein n=1 Tax=Virgisporangium ochraceum TaxID=65505 RepID=UPI0019428CBF|nr:Gfo/Idh/MocA family oxidoreductase [Virgisporangium ochraceum]
MRIAIVGAGTTARHHVEALRALDDRVEIVAGVDSVDGDAGHAAAFCAGHGIPYAGTDLKKALADAAPDLVHVCAGDPLEPVSAALAGGAHVLVEPPPALSLRGLDDLDAAQAPGGPYVAMVFPHRFGPGPRRLRDLVATGALGRPLLALCHTTWWRERGGLLTGPGTYHLDLLVSVLGGWTEIQAAAHRLARPGRAEDVSLAHVTFANGAVASIVTSVLSPREESHVRFDLERASVELTRVRGHGDHWRVTPAPGHEKAVLAAWNAHTDGGRRGLPAQVADVVSSVRAGTPPPVSPAAARDTVRLVAGIYAAAFTGHLVAPAGLEPGSAFYERMEGFGPPWA